MERKYQSIICLFVYLAIVAFYPTTPVFAQVKTSQADFSIVFPIVAPRITSTFGVRKHPVYKRTRHHRGVDLAAPSNSHIRAVLDGVVVFADRHGGFGKLVTIRHKNGYTSMYGHLKEIRVNIGQGVKAGDVIGRLGKSGTATGPHLHFEWRRNGEALDPLKAFPLLGSAAAG